MKFVYERAVWHLRHININNMVHKFEPIQAFRFLGREYRIKDHELLAYLLLVWLWFQQFSLTADDVFYYDDVLVFEGQGYHVAATGES